MIYYIVSVYQYYCRYEEILKMKHIFFSSVISYFIPVFMMAPMYGYMVVQARKQVGNKYFSHDHRIHGVLICILKMKF